MKRITDQSRVVPDSGNIDPNEDFQEVIIRSKLIESKNMTPHVGEAILPGDIISFEYSYLQDKNRYGVYRNPRWNSSQRVGIVVKSDRTTTGKFLSTKGNMLLNIFLINNISESTLHILFKYLYRNRVACTYKTAPKILDNLVGSENFRTLKFNHVRQVYHMSPDWSKVIF